MTLVTPPQVVKRSVTTTDNSPSKDYSHLENQAIISHAMSLVKVIMYFHRSLVEINDMSFLPACGNQHSNEE